LKFHKKELNGLSVYASPKEDVWVYKNGEGNWAWQYFESDNFIDGDDYRYRTKAEAQKAAEDWLIERERDLILENLLWEN